jgi:hypothetical protein
VGEIENLETVAGNTEETKADNGKTHVSFAVELLVILEARVLCVPLSSARSAEIVSCLVQDLVLGDVRADELAEVN